MNKVCFFLIFMAAQCSLMAQTNRYFTPAEAQTWLPQLIGYNMEVIGEKNDRGIGAGQNNVEFIFVSDTKNKIDSLSYDLSKDGKYKVYKSYAIEGLYMLTALAPHLHTQLDSFNLWTVDMVKFGFDHDSKLYGWNLQDTTKAKRVDSFWNWFTENQKEYYKLNPKKEKKTEASFDKLQSKLIPLNPNFVFEFSSIKENGKREFVLSADGQKTAFGDLIYLYIKSPILKNWEMVLFKQPSDVDPKIKLPDDFTLAWNDVMFEYKKTTAGLSIDFYINGYTPEEEEKFGAALIILLDSYLGEYDAVMQIYRINVGALTDEGRGEHYKFEALKNVVESYKKYKRER